MPRQQEDGKGFPIKESKTHPMNVVIIVPTRVGVTLLINLSLVVYTNVFFCGLRTHSLSSCLVLIAHARVCLLALVPLGKRDSWIRHLFLSHSLVLLPFSRASPQINWYFNPGTIPPVLRPCHQNEPLHECVFLCKQNRTKKSID